MGLGKLFTRPAPGPEEARNLKFEVTNTKDGTRGDFTIITDGGPGMFPDWQKGEYRGGMGIPAAWRLALLVANQLGRTPWHSYRSVAGKPPEKIEPQPTLLAYPSADDQPALNVWRSAALDRIWHGNAIGIIAARSPLGYPTSAVWVDAESVIVDRFGADPVTGYNPPPPGFAPGERGYLIGGRWYHRDEIIHWCGPCRPGQLRGMGVLENHFQTLSRTQALDTAASAVTSAGVPTGLLESLNPDLTQAEAEDLKAGWVKSQRNRTVAVLNPSTKFTPIAWNPTETQLLESRQYSITDWANIFGLPSSYAGGQNASRVYANIVDQGMDILRYGLVGDMVAEFEALFTSLLPRGQYVKGNLDHLLRADTKGRYEAHAIALAAKFLTADEVRELEEKPPLTDEQKKAIQEAAAPPVPPGGAGPQPARPTQASSSPGSGSARPRLAAVRARELVADLMGRQRYDLAMAVIDTVRDFRAWQLRAFEPKGWELRGYPEFNQHQPRWPKGTGKKAGEWTDHGAGRAPYGAKGAGTWSKGKWASWENGTHQVGGSTFGGGGELVSVGTAVTKTKADPMSKKSQAEAEFDAFVDELDTNPTAGAKGAPVLDADMEEFLAQVQADVDAKMADEPAAKVEKAQAKKAAAKTLAEAAAAQKELAAAKAELEAAGPKPGTYAPKPKPLETPDANIGNVSAPAEVDDFEAFLDSMPSIPDDYYDWPLQKQHTWYDTPGTKAEKDAAAAKWDADNAKAAPGTPWTEQQWEQFFDDDGSGQTIPDFVPKDATQIELIADQLSVTPPPKALQKKLTTGKQWEAYWQNAQNGMPPGSATAAAIAADPEAKKKAADAEEAAFLASQGIDPVAAGGDDYDDEGPPAPVIPSTVPASKAELDQIADKLGVDIPPKGVGSLSWSSDQWKTYWQESVFGLKPQFAAAKANGQDVTPSGKLNDVGGPTPDDFWAALGKGPGGKPLGDGGLPGASPNLLGANAPGVSLGGGSTVGPGQKFGNFEVGGAPVPIEPKPYGAAGSKANKIAKKYGATVGAIPQWEYSAAQNYSGSGYTSMNSALWNDNFDGASDLTKAQIANMSNLINRWEAPETITAMRGLDFDPAMPDPPADGKTYTSKGFQSTSIGTGAFTSKSVVMKITVPKGTKAAVMNGGGLSHFPHEEEMVLPHNTRYAVTKDYMKGGKRWLEVTALPPE